MTYRDDYRNRALDDADATEGSTAAALALAAAEPADLTDGVKYAVVPAGATHEILDLEEYGAAPRRKKGTAVFVDPESFAAYFARHGGADVFLYASQQQRAVTAVFNDDAADGTPGWRDHRAVLQLQVTEEWKHWEVRDGKQLSQLAFAEHIQEGLSQVAAPPAADLLELVQDFEVTSKSTFRQGEKLSTGERRLTFIEENKAGGAGAARTVDLPAQISLSIAPWVGSAAFNVDARFSYRARAEEGVSFKYQLVEPHVALDEAFKQVTQGLGEATGAKVLHGTPASTY